MRPSSFLLTGYNLVSSPPPKKIKNTDKKGLDSLGTISFLRLGPLALRKDSQ